MRVEVFTGDITDAPAEAICTSTNPRLTLMMGTGASVRERGGFDVLRACERIVDLHRAATGRPDLPIGSVHRTAAGALPYRGVIHCVASGAAHASSPEIIRVVTRRAIDLAVSLGYSSLAVPVFGSGHAHVKFDRALAAMSDVFRSTDAELLVVVVVNDQERAARAREILI